MRVFILCTGRTGSTSFIKACKHISNFSAGHEMLANKFGEKRFDYPDDHIEADNRLSWHLGDLGKKYGDDALYIHLKRNRAKVANSFFKRFYRTGGIIDAFCEGIRKTPSELLSDEMRLQACFDYVDTVNANVEYFISNKPNTMTMTLENINSDFRVFWDKIEAEGDWERAIEEFNVKHNVSRKRTINLRYRIKLFAIREWRNIRISMKS